MSNSDSPTPMSCRPLPANLGRRAKHRLRLAGALLHRPGLTPEALGEEFYRRVLHTLDALGEDHRDRLRAMVDWVEAYEQEEQQRW